MHIITALLAIIIIITCSRHVTGQSCVLSNSDPCSCDTSNGEGIISLRNLGSGYFDVPSTGHNYRLFPCSTPNWQSPCDPFSGAVACQQAEGSSYYTLGDYSYGDVSIVSSRKFASTQSAGQWQVIFYFTGGSDGKQSTIKLICDTTVNDTNVRFIDNKPQFQYNFEITSNKACPVAVSNPTPSGGDDYIEDLFKLGIISIILALTSCISTTLLCSVFIIIGLVKLYRTQNNYTRLNR